MQGEVQIKAAVRESESSTQLINATEARQAAGFLIHTLDSTHSYFTLFQQSRLIQPLCFFFLEVRIFLVL